MNLGNKKQLSIYAVFALINAILAGKMLVEFGNLTNLALSKDFDAMVRTGFVVAIVCFLQIIVWLFRNQYIKTYMKDSMIALRENYVSRILKRHKLDESNAKYVSHLTNDADRLEQQHFLNVIELIGLMMTVLVSSYILADISWVFVGVIIVIAVIFYIFARKTSQPVKKEETVKSKELERYTHFIEESLDGFATIKSHQFERTRAAQFDTLISALRKRQYQLEKKVSMVGALNGVVQGCVIATLSVLGMSLAKQSGFGIGETMVIVLVFSDILWPLQRFTPLVTEMSGIKTVFESYDAVLEGDVVSGTTQVKGFDSLVFNGASLGYDCDILKHVNLEIMRNEKVLIVGPSGAGKSTVLKTIMRDIDCIQGSVLLNGSPSDRYDLASYYGTFSVVDQIGFIFSGTIQENVSMLENHDVQDILEDVNLAHLNQLDVLKNNGDTLSGGERARILLARSQYFNKEVIVCDEILSSLDSSVARLIEKDILKNAKTLINVSHIVFKDNLELYDKFVIVEEGGLSVTDNPKYVLDRMLESDVEIQ